MSSIVALLYVKFNALSSQILIFSFDYTTFIPYLPLNIRVSQPLRPAFLSFQQFFYVGFSSSVPLHNKAHGGLYHGLLNGAVGVRSIRQTNPPFSSFKNRSCQRWNSAIWRTTRIPSPCSGSFSSFMELLK